jgi:hypothetical protein
VRWFFGLEMDLKFFSFYSIINQDMLNFNPFSQFSVFSIYAESVCVLLLS